MKSKAEFSIATIDLLANACQEKTINIRKFVIHKKRESNTIVSQAKLISLTING